MLDQSMPDLIERIKGISDIVAWRKFVSELSIWISDELKAIPESVDKYNGFYCFDGPVLKRPKILFIGINPGLGGQNEGDDLSVHEFDPRYKSEISYLDPDEKERYPMAAKTIKMLDLGGLDSQIVLRTESMKTNLYHIVTRGERGIKPCLDLIGPKSFDEYYGLSTHLIQSLINILCPKLVIFEGKTVYFHVMNCAYNLKDDIWNTLLKIGYYKYIHDGCTINLLGYQRRKRYIDTDLYLIAEKINECCLR